MGENKNQQASKFKYTLLCGVSSFIASFFSNIVHPLEVIKTRFQSHDGSQNEKNIVPKYGGIYSAIRTIVRSQGVSGLFKGFFVSFLSQSSTQTLFFTIYQNRLINYSNPTRSYMAAVSRASFEASILATAITQPLWIIRTRMLLTTSKFNEIQNFKHNTIKLYEQYGMKGYFRGMVISLFLSMGGLIQMYVYEGCKLIFKRFDKQNKQAFENYILNYRAFISGGLSKLVSSLVMYPFTTIRTRYQQNQFLVNVSNPKYSNSFEIMSRIIYEQGVLGFYKGFYVNMVKGFLQRGLYFYCYQLCKKVLGIQDKIEKKQQ